MLAALLLVGCLHNAPSGPLPPRAEDPVALLGLAQHDPSPGGVLGEFSGLIHSGGKTLPARGSLMVQAPSRFRLEVRGPIGGAALVVATSGDAIVGWVASSNTSWVLADADAALKDVLMDDSAGVASIVALVLGRVPRVATPPVVRVGMPTPTYRWGASAGGVEVVLDPGSARLTRGEVFREDGTTLLQIDATPGGGPDFLPRSLEVRVPLACGPDDEACDVLHAELRFDGWSRITPEPSAFDFAPPEGSTVRPVELGKRD